MRGRELLEYRVLGPTEALRDGIPLNIGVYKQRALLALLLVEANRVVSTDRIIDELWANTAGKDPQNALWVVVSRLRSALEPDRASRSDGTVLLTRAPGYMISVDRGRLDTHRFEDLVVEGRALLQTDPDSASLLLGEALALWRGRALEEFTYEPFAQAEIARLEEMRITVVEDRVEADLQRGVARHLVGELEALVRQHPMRERPSALLMLALHRSGRQTDALRVFGAFRERLAEEAGLEPSTDITGLEERILLDDSALRVAAYKQAGPDAYGPGFAVRGFELRTEIARGSEGLVYRAFQPVVGREVAIKVFRPELANDAGFIRGFEADVRTVVGLDHQHIAPILDYWREPDAAFLVTPWYQGGSLEDRMAVGGLDVDAAVGLIEQVGDALAVAHGRGVTHGDLRPSAVLIDSEGVAHLSGFGVSTTQRVSPYTAPECRAAGVATPRSDLYSLAVLADEILPAAAHDGHPGLRAVLERAQSAISDRRQPDVGTFLAELSEAVDGGSSVRATHEISNPYRGLWAFQESDAAQYFGRDRTVERLLVRIAEPGARGRLVTLVGPSGSGKSSVIRAGLIPALRGGALPGSEHWFFITAIPGTDPFGSLAEALMKIAVDPPPNLRELLESGIPEAVERVLPDPAAQVLIVIDQLEELFSRAESPDAESFLTALADSAGHPRSHVKIVTTLRADFYDHPLRHREFGGHLRLGTEVIGAMSVEELTQAIEMPAATVGVSFEQGLVGSIIGEMAGQPSALPLLQYALTELFEARSGDLITRASYREMGGVSAALARRADSLYVGFDPAMRETTKDIFLRLVTVGDASRDTRRRVLASELSEATRLDPAPALTMFGLHRLLTFDRDPIARAPTVEIAHEALLTEWDRLRRWIDDARLDIQAEHRLAIAATEWSERGEDPDFLLARGRLQRFEGWLVNPPVRLTAVERRYLEAAKATAERDEKVEHRRLRRLRRLVAGIGGALVLALVAGGVAFAQRRAAEDAAGRAELATLISRSAAVGEDDSELALLLALEAHRRSKAPDTEQAVLAALGNASIAGRVASTAALPDECVGFSTIPDVFGGMVEFATIDGRLVKRDPAGGAVIDVGPTPGPCAVGTFHDGVGAAVTPDLMRGWFGEAFELEMEFDVPTRPEWITADRVVLRSGLFEDEDDVVALHDVATGERLGSPVSGGIWLDVAVNSDASLFAISFVTPSAPEGEGSVFVVDGATGEGVVSVRTEEGPQRLAFDPTTGHLLIGFLGGRITTVNPDDGSILDELLTDEIASFADLRVRAGGDLAVVSPGGIFLVDLVTGEVERVVELRNAALGWVRPDGLVVVRDVEGGTEVFDLEQSAVVRSSWRTEPTGLASFNDRHAAILSPESQTVEWVQLDTGERVDVDLFAIEGDPFVASAVHPVADGFWMVSLEHELAHVVDGAVVDRQSIGSSVDVLGVRLGRTLTSSLFGDRLAVLGRRVNGVLETSLIRLEAGGAVVEAVMDTPDALSVHPSAEGGLHVVTASGAVNSYGREGEVTGRITTGQVAADVVTLDPSGRMLAIGSEDGGVAVVDLASGLTERFSGEEQVVNLGFGPDGRLLAIATLDGTIRLWDTERSVPAGVVWNGSGAFTGEPGWFDRSSNTLWMSTAGRIIEIPLDPASWVSTACEIVGRELTEPEWERYVPGNGARVSACAAA